MNHVEIFQNNFRDLLERRGMSARDASFAIGISTATLSRYLNGLRVPELEYVIKIAQFFNVSIDWLVGLSDKKLSGIPDESYDILEKYTLASPTDKGIIKAVLSRYENDNKID